MADTQGTPPQSVPQPMPAPPPAVAVLPVAALTGVHLAAAWASLALGVLLALVTIFRGGTPALPVVPVVPDGVQQHVPADPPTGWVDDPAAVKAVRESLPVGERYFGDTPAGRAVMGDEKDVLLSDGVKKLLGKHIPARNQRDVGSCVGFATTSAVEYLIALQALEAGMGPAAFRDLVQEVLYALSRVEVGGGRIRGDGSVTAWSGEAAKRFGVISRGIYGKFDLTQYDTGRCRDWGRSGLPDELEPIAKQSPVKGITFVRSAEEAAKAIRQGYPIAQGSGVGFGARGPYRRDADGFLRASGSWGHCMACIGVVGGKRPGFLILNSWGPDWVEGPTGGRDIPAGSFFVDWGTHDRMCKEGDAIAFSDAVGFPERDPWFILQANPAPARRQERVVFASELAP